MFKIYSPDNYFSLFGKYPAIFVEDSGLMYSQKEYTALLRNPIGKIDFTTGYLYGSDCLAASARPIGQIRRQDSGDYFIYGDNYFRLGAVPKFYIRNGRIYPWKEYGNLLPAEAGYIEGEIPMTVQEPALSMPSQTAKASSVRAAAPKEESSGSGCGSTLLSILGFLLVAAIAVLLPIQLFKGGLGEDEMKAAYVIAAVGTLIAAFFSKHYLSAVSIIIGFGALSITVLDLYSTVVEQDGVGEFIIELLFGLPIGALMFALPALALGGIAGGIKWLLWARKRPEKYGDPVKKKKKAE